MFTVICFFAHVGNHLGDDNSFLIAPQQRYCRQCSRIYGNVCHRDKSSPSQARECYPNGMYDFKAGQIIDFTWGVTENQEGKIVFGVVPAQSVVAAKR
jgi:hypothetical protein